MRNEWRIVFVRQNENSDGWLQRTTVVRQGYTGKIEAADLQINPEGTYLYASNRGDANEIVVFKIDQLTGQLSLVQRISSHGKSPRNLLLDPSGSFMLAANENSDSVTVFQVNKTDGKLSFSGRVLNISKPACLNFYNKRGNLT